MQVLLSLQRLQTPELTASSLHESAGWVVGTDTTARRVNNLHLGWKSKATGWAGLVSPEASSSPHMASSLGGTPWRLFHKGPDVSD